MNTSNLIFLAWIPYLFPKQSPSTGFSFSVGSSRLSVVNKNTGLTLGSSLSSIPHNQSVRKNPVVFPFNTSPESGHFSISSVLPPSGKPLSSLAWITATVSNCLSFSAFAPSSAFVSFQKNSW